MHRDNSEINNLLLNSLYQAWQILFGLKSECISLKRNKPKYTHVAKSTFLLLSSSKNDLWLSCNPLNSLTWILSSCRVYESNYKAASLSRLSTYQTAKLRGNFQGHTDFPILEFALF